MSNEMVLIVEDEFAIAELLEMALTDGGYRVVVAANGRQGLERLAQDPTPDLVISDFMMPVLDGARFLHAMRETELAPQHPLHHHKFRPRGECAHAHRGICRLYPQAVQAH